MTAPARPTAIVLACACTALAVLAGCSSTPASPADDSAAGGSASAPALLSNLPREQTMGIGRISGLSASLRLRGSQQILRYAPFARRDSVDCRGATAQIAHGTAQIGADVNREKGGYRTVAAPTP